MWAHILNKLVLFEADIWCLFLNEINQTSLCLQVSINEMSKKTIILFMFTLVVTLSNTLHYFSSSDSLVYCITYSWYINSLYINIAQNKYNEESRLVQSFNSWKSPASSFCFDLHITLCPTHTKQRCIVEVDPSSY